MIYEFIADGFEEVEALCPLDMLRRAGADIKTVSITPSKEVTGSHAICVKADITLKEIDELPEMVILPGGMPGAKNLRNSAEVCRIVTDTYENDGYLAAICAAPFILGELGLLQGKQATCFPGFEKSLTGAILSSEKVVRDGKVITAAGMGAAIPFGAELVKTLFGLEKAEALLKAILAV